jgi:broad specificity phosphatase PhoE
VRRLFLVRHAPTSATRSFAFPADEPLDERGTQAAAGLAAALPRHAAVLCSPALRCRQTAQAAGLDVTGTDPDLQECDFGTWRGQTLEALNAGDAESVAAWMGAPDAVPHGGESQKVFCARVGAWLDAQASLDGSAVVITHGGVVKAAVVHALGAPIRAFWQVDVAPLSVTELHAHDGRWTVARVNEKLA